MKCAYLRFYEELNDYLPPDKRKSEFACCFEGEVTVGKLVQAAGIPVSIIDLILSNGESVGPGQRVRHGDRISIYPVFESFDITGATSVRDEPLRQPRFLASVGLERLAAYLRMLGFDAVCSAGGGANEDVKIAEAQRRILVIRDRGTECRGSRTLEVRGAKPREQATEVLLRLDLFRLIAPLTRCPRCNRTLVNRPGTAQCESCSGAPCGKAYLQRMNALINCLRTG